MQRRKFIKNTILSTSGLAACSQYALATNSIFGNISEKFFIGAPVLPEYLYENGIANTLDQMQEWAGINAVMTFSHDHVFNQYRPQFRAKTNHEGVEYTNTWVNTNSIYYNNALQGKRDNRLFSDRDILDELWEEAAPRNMLVYARILEAYKITGAIPGFENFAEENALEEKGDNVCFNHPEYIKYWDSVVEDLIRTHPYLHGFKFGQERGGPILSTLGKKRPGTCFCIHCQKKAKEQGFEINKARKGLLEIQKFGNEILAGKKPVDGNFVSFLRILFQNPEVLELEQFWMDSREDQRKRIYKKIKGLNNKVLVGWHIDHGMTWDLITRATWDYSKMSPYSDWLSVAVYFDSMGRRSMNHFDKNFKKILFGDATEELAYQMYLSMLGYDPVKQPKLSEHRVHDTSFSADYVFTECKRAVQSINGVAKVHARPGFDMPGYECNVSPEDVYQATLAALGAGVDGLWCGREWDELKPENAQAFGKAISDYLSR